MRDYKFLRMRICKQTVSILGKLNFYITASRRGTHQSRAQNILQWHRLPSLPSQLVSKFWLKHALTMTLLRSGSSRLPRRRPPRTINSVRLPRNETTTSWCSRRRTFSVPSLWSSCWSRSSRLVVATTCR